MAKRRVWRGTLTVQGQWSGDRRRFDEFRFRDMPLSVQRGIYGGHDTAPAVGTIEASAVGGLTEKGGTLWWGIGYLDSTAEGDDAAERVESASQRYLSVNPAEYVEPVQEVYAPGDVLVTQEQLYEAYADAMQALDDGDEEKYAEIMLWLDSLEYRYRWPTYLVGGVTLVTIPCYEEARMEIIGWEGDVDLAAALAEVTQATALPASGGPADGPGEEPVTDPFLSMPPTRPLWDLTQRMMAEGAPQPSVDRLPAPVVTRLTAAGGPVLMPAALFQRETFTEPTRFTLDTTADGWTHMHGHIAVEGVCHISWGEKCVEMPTTAQLEKWIHGSTPLDDGTKAVTGIITYGGPHAGDELGDLEAEIQRRIEDIGTQLGTVTAWRDEWGVAVSGCVHADVPPGALNRVLAAAPSGDWRDYLFFDQRWQRGDLELFGVHIVNTPGFPTPRRQVSAGGLRLLASARALEVAPGCGCGGHGAGACTCHPQTTKAERLMRLASLDRTHALRQPVG